MQKITDGLAAFAGLMGACGVAAAAAAAHAPGGARMASVALILLVHAAAILDVTTRAKDATSRLWLAAALVLAFGATLFSADVSLLTLRGTRLFPMAAPTGGVTMILGWLIVAIAGLAGFSRRSR